MSRRKNGNGQGSIYFDKTKDRWCAAYTLPGGRRQVKRFRTREEADMFLQKTRLEIYNGEYVPETQTTIGEWLITYITVYKQNLKPNTLRNYFMYAQYLTPLADMSLSRPNVPRIQQFFSSPDTRPIRRLSFTFLHAACKKAYRLGKIRSNFMAMVDPPRVTPSQKPEVYSREELQKIFHFLETDPHYRIYLPLFSILKFTGMRIGEALALKWSDIDLFNGVIHIQRNAVSLPHLGMIVQSMPKTQSAVRDVTMPKELCLLLSALKNGKIVKIGIGDTYLFTTRYGAIQNLSNIQRLWALIQERASVERKKVHTLRHTHASYLLANHVPLADVSRRLGHASPATTLNVYTHFIPNNDRKVADMVSAIYSEK